MARANLVPIARQVEPTTNKSSSEFAVRKFLFTNICSLAKTKNRVRAAVALEADLNNKDIDICVVSETHLKPEMPDAIVNIPGYNIFRRDRDWSGLDSRCKGGIAIFARSNLDVIGYRSELYELLCLTFKLPSGHLLLVCGVYHPPPANIQAFGLSTIPCSFSGQCFRSAPSIDHCIGRRYQPTGCK